jgi:hypothetical protein
MIVGNALEELQSKNEITNHFLQIFVSHNIRHKGVLTPDHFRGMQNEHTAIKNVNSDENKRAVTDAIQQLCTKGSRFASVKDIEFILKNKLT